MRVYESIYICLCAYMLYSVGISSFHNLLASLLSLHPMKLPFFSVGNDYGRDAGGYGRIYC